MNTILSSSSFQAANDGKLRGTVRDLKPFTMLLDIDISIMDDDAEADILSIKGDTESSLILRTGEIEEKLSLCFDMQFDFRKGPLILSCPIKNLADTPVSMVVIRYSGPTLEMFVNGMLVDEEWPAGSPLTSGETHKVDYDHAVISFVHVWERILTNEEIGSLSSIETAHRAEESNIDIYWKPKGHNTGVGDCMPFYRNGEYHLFYLFDRRQHGSKWGLGAHQWAHASTKDMKTWSHHPVAVPITEEWEGSICTGSIFYDQGTYYCFYSIRDIDGKGAPLQRSVSRDGMHFEKDRKKMHVILEAPYDPVPARDPCVFKDNEGRYHMLVTTQLKHPVMNKRRGTLAHHTSSDLSSWKQEEPFILPGYIDQPECSDYFKWKGWYYLIFSNHGVARYLHSREPFGPWEKPVYNVFDGPLSGVMKTAEYINRRRIGAAFLRRKGYGGNLILREIIQNKNGTLATRFVPELLPSQDKSTPMDFSPLTSGIDIRKSNEVFVDAHQSFSACEIKSNQRNFYLRVDVEVEDGCSSFGLCLRAARSYEDGMELKIEPGRKKVGWRPVTSADWVEFEKQSIYSVDEITQACTIEIIARDDILDACIAGSKTLITHVDTPAYDNAILIFAHFGKALFRNVSITPL